MEGKAFQEFKVYAECAASMHAVVELPHRKQSLFGRDLEELFARRWTFASAIASDLPIMTRQRLKTFWRDTVGVNRRVPQEMDGVTLVAFGWPESNNTGETPAPTPSQPSASPKNSLKGPDNSVAQEGP